MTKDKDPEEKAIDHELNLEKELLKSGDIEDVDAEYAKLYTQGIVPETDDPSAPSLSIRMILLGTIFAVLLGLMNGIFSFRTNSFYISSNIAAILSYPMGIFLAAVLPRGILNPGPFTIKEHVLVYMIAGAAGGQPYGVENVIGQKFDKFMGDTRITFWNSILFVITTQMIGYGLSGMTRRFLVRPAAMYWPTVLSTVALFVSFHETEESEESKKVGGLSRFSFFWLAFCVMFIYQWIPTFFATALQALSVICMFTHASKTARFLGSASPNTGVGILSFSLDWSNIGSGVISIPWWVIVNSVFSNIVVLWIIVPITYYRNTFGNPTLAHVYTFEDGTPFPILNTPALFTKTGARIRATSFYDRNNFELNETAYDLVKPIYLTEMFAVSYSMSFFALTCGISHVALWYYKDIIRQTKEMFNQVDEAHADIHNELMKAYPDIPEWMYMSWLAFWLVVMLFVGIFTPFHLPWWGTLFGLVLAFIFLIPYGIIQGSSGQQLGLNIITELLMGLFIPGQTVAVMTFKSYSYNIMIQALSLTYDLKVGHYLHINPVHMVISQLWGTIIGAFSNTAAVWIAIDYFPLGNEDWSYPGHTTFFNAGAIWGAIGPGKFFGASSPYFSLNLGYLFGAILPILPWLANKGYPHPYWRFVHFPIMAGIAGAGGIQSSLLSSLIISYIFMYYLFTYSRPWWTKYNYVLASALDSGSGVGVLLSTLVAMKVIIPPSAANPPLFDFYCTGSNWDSEQFL
ncbi:OPT family small oligopeptide transporter [Batrachochytrium dendrobatidis JEL423]|uniref:OPT family small oligopeptide transporter n=1 Tax=Batrachochytrium dendrobatidis (strain JEL423) TaxID=403673 RepID=A0A177WWD0_BATDL|nr:OPT family small oligopeptide transporter [Batrachochytrium dendrobatidis JEL423]